MLTKNRKSLIEKLSFDQEKEKAQKQQDSDDDESTEESQGEAVQHPYKPQLAWATQTQTQHFAVEESPSHGADSGQPQHQQHKTIDTLTISTTPLGPPRHVWVNPLDTGAPVLSPQYTFIDKRIRSASSQARLTAAAVSLSPRLSLTEESIPIIVHDNYYQAFLYHLRDLYSIFTLQSLILPHSRSKRYWDWFLLLTILYNTLALPFLICFAASLGDTSLIISFDLCTAALMTIDIAMIVRTAMHDLNGHLIFDPIEIRRRYTSSYRFALDLFCTFPFFLFPHFLYQGGTYTVFSVNLCKLPSVLRAHRIFTSPLIQRTFSSPKLRIFKFLMWFLYVAHVFACAYFFIGTQEPGGQTNSWIIQRGIQQADIVSQYIDCMLWSLETMVTVGYGGTNVPVTVYEQSYVILVLIITGAIYAAVFSNVAEALQSLTTTVRRYQDLKASMIEFIAIYRLPSELANKIIYYAQENWHHSKGFSIHSIIHQLPLSVQAEILLYINHSLIVRVPLFQQCSRKFLEAIILKLHNEVCLPGDFVFREGDMSRDMYFIKLGKVSILTDNPTTTAATTTTTTQDSQAMTEIGVVSADSEYPFFGEISLLLGETRTASVCAVEKTMLSKISQQDFYEVMSLFPNEEDTLREVAMQRLSADLIRMQEIEQHTLKIAQQNKIQNIALFALSIFNQKAQMRLRTLQNAQQKRVLQRSKSQILRLQQEEEAEAGALSGIERFRRVVFKVMGITRDMWYEKHPELAIAHGVFLKGTNTLRRATQLIRQNTKKALMAAVDAQVHLVEEKKAETHAYKLIRSPNKAASISITSISRHNTFTSPTATSTGEAPIMTSMSSMSSLASATSLAAVTSMVPAQDTMSTAAKMQRVNSLTPSGAFVRSATEMAAARKAFVHQRQQSICTLQQAATITTQSNEHSRRTSSISQEGINAAAAAVDGTTRRSSSISERAGLARSLLHSHSLQKVQETDAQLVAAAGVQTGNIPILSSAGSQQDVLNPAPPLPQKAGFLSELMDGKQVVQRASLTGASPSRSKTDLLMTLQQSGSTRDLMQINGVNRSLINSRVGSRSSSRPQTPAAAPVVVVPNLSVDTDAQPSPTAAVPNGRHLSSMRSSMNLNAPLDKSSMIQQLQLTRDKTVISPSGAMSRGGPTANNNNPWSPTKAQSQMWNTASGSTVGVPPADMASPRASGSTPGHSASTTMTALPTLSVDTDSAPLSFRNLMLPGANTGSPTNNLRVGGPSGQGSPLNRTMTKRQTTSALLVDKLATVGNTWGTGQTPKSIHQRMATLAGNQLLPYGGASGSGPTTPSGAKSPPVLAVPVSASNIAPSIDSPTSELATLRKQRDQKLTQIAGGEKPKRRTLRLGNPIDEDAVQQQQHHNTTDSLNFSIPLPTHTSLSQLMQSTASQRSLTRDPTQSSMGLESTQRQQTFSSANHARQRSTVLHQAALSTFYKE